jgi:hypothetical protein
LGLQGGNDPVLSPPSGLQVHSAKDCGWVSMLEARLTKKHFEAIAKVFAGEYSPHNTVEHENMRAALAKELANEFKQFNRYFDAAKFLHACRAD